MLGRVCECCGRVSECWDQVCECWSKCVNTGADIVNTGVKFVNFWAKCVNIGAESLRRLFCKGTSCEHNLTFNVEGCTVYKLHFINYQVIQSLSKAEVREPL